MKYAERMKRIVPSGIRKVNEKALEMERNGETILHFEIGRPDFLTPDYICKSCIHSIQEGDVFYTSNFGDMELRKEVASYLDRRCRIPCTAENILITVGLSEAVFDLLTVILDSEDEILVPNPVWINYINVPNLLGAKPVSYDLLEENAYQPDLAEIESKITRRTKAIVLVSPNNPTGSILEKESLEKIAELAKKHDLLVLSDEVYERLIYDKQEHISIASLPGMMERTITLNGFSKAYSMTGWRLGYAAAPPELIQEMNKIHQHNVICAPSFVQKAAITALRDEKDEEAIWSGNTRGGEITLFPPSMPSTGSAASAPKAPFIFSSTSASSERPLRRQRIFSSKQKKSPLFPAASSAPTGTIICACPLQTVTKTLPKAAKD